MVIILPNGKRALCNGCGERKVVHKVTDLCEECELEATVELFSRSEDDPDPPSEKGFRVYGLTRKDQIERRRHLQNLRRWGLEKAGHPFPF